jgi:cytochrome c556
MKRLYSVGVAAALATMSVMAVSQGAPGGPPNPAAQAKTAIETRQAVFKLINNQNGPIGGMLRNRVEFDAAVVARNAARIEMLATMIPDLFVTDTRQFKDTKTLALDGIWASQADFKAKADGLNKAAAALAEVAKTGDKANTLKAAADVGKACGACHDNYRAKP